MGANWIRKKRHSKTLKKAEVEADIEAIKRATDKLIAEITRPADVKVLQSTALLLPSFVAYLDEKQVKKLAADKRVVRLEQDTYLQTSALWNDSTINGQIRSWGIDAMGAGYASPSNGAARVFVIDLGVEMHSDLPGYSWANNLHPTLNQFQNYPCWSHDTHVAGIIGAGNDGSGTVGMLPGVELVFLAVTDTYSPSPDYCAIGLPTSHIIWALDKVKLMAKWNFVGWNQQPQLSIVNISINTAEQGTENIFKLCSSVGDAMKALATPGYVNFPLMGLF